MTTGSHSEPCINWPCAKGAGHAGPCGTSRDELSSKEQLAEILSDAHAIHCAAEVGMPCDCRVPDAIAELLRRAEPPNVWQPIETAPKLGKWVLLWWPAITDAAFVGYCVDGVWRAATSGDKWPGIDGPTHWMPLPAGPAVTKEESQ